MSRPLRIEFPGAIYHVTSRGDRREPIFDDDTDREAFLETVGAALERFDGCALAYCLMDNHYHLVLHTRRANLSMLMRHINGVYTQAYNRRHRKVGHLFQGRFKAILVDQDAYLLEVCRYVDLNPVRAHLVKHPVDWPWSSYRAHVGQMVPRTWLDTPAVHGYLLGRDATTVRDIQRAARRYAELVEQGKGVRLWDDALKQQIFLGDDGFIRRMQALLEPERTRAVEVPRAQRCTRPDSIQSYLKTYERNEAIVRACREGGHTLSAIAREVGLSVSRVSRIVNAYKPRLSIRPASAFVHRSGHAIGGAFDTTFKPTRASLAPGRPFCAQLLGEVFNLACDRRTQTVSTMGGAPSRVLMDNLG